MSISGANKMAADKLLTIGNCQASYELGKIIKKNTEATVYQAHSKNDPKRRLIVKRVISQHLDPIISELTIYTGVTHPHIIKPIKLYFSTADKENKYFLDVVMEEGTPLLQYLNEHKLSLKQKKRLIIDLINTLHFLRSNGILYGDIKINNLIILNGRLVVIDFGLTLKVTDPDSKIIQSYNDLGSYVIRYRKTFKHNSEDYDVITGTVWALGITILEIIKQFDYGKLCLTIDLFEHIINLTYYPERTIQQYHGDLGDPRLLKLLVRLFGDPKQRYRSYSDILADPFFGLDDGLTGRLDDGLTGRLDDGLTGRLDDGKIKRPLSFPKVRPNLIYPPIILSYYFNFDHYQDKTKILATELFLRLYRLLVLTKNYIKEEVQPFYEACLAIALASEASEYQFVSYGTEHLKWVREIILFTGGWLYLENPYRPQDKTLKQIFDFPDFNTARKLDYRSLVALIDRYNSIVDEWSK